MGTYYNPRIVTNGLVLALDAANAKSYPGSGTAWTDLSGRGNNATMYGSVPFETDVVPCFNFATATGASSAASTLGFTFASNMVQTTGDFTFSSRFQLHCRHLCGITLLLYMIELHPKM